MTERMKCMRDKPPRFIHQPAAADPVWSTVGGLFAWNWKIGREVR